MREKAIYELRQYQIWYDMKRRCNESTRKQYKDYGGRGITYDPRWEDFSNFWDDMKDLYDDSLTLDRIDPDGNYCKENCRWVSRDFQACNKRMYVSNKLGISNIFIGKNKGHPELVCKITKDGKCFKKRLLLTKYSLNEAIDILVQWRDMKRNELGFSEYHGK